MDQRSSKVGPLNPLRVHKNRESAAPDPIIDTQLADILQYQKQSFSWAIAREESSPNEHEERNQKPRERDWQPPGAVVPTGPEEEEEEEEGWETGSGIVYTTIPVSITYTSSRCGDGRQGLV
ncbi:UNVERIFIED_CONTAM: hypothetical protein FKN15_006142 [Acipenser sinensis]